MGAIYLRRLRVMRFRLSTWPDSRLDELNNRVSDMDARLTGRIDALQHTMVQAFIALVVIMVSGFMGLAGLIITQL
jgi:ABC-type transport system involved in cytochrome bd biosynthesis fused ATPase/permease subunit